MTRVEAAPATTSLRITTLDAVRGFAVMGILLLNIVDFGMPGYAYIDPNYYGGATGADWWAWATTYVFADGKMRGLFTMMFGASCVLIAEQAVGIGQSPARVHYSRMFWLFVIGMIHAYLIWAGDILVLYAVSGALMFALWRWRARALLALGIALLMIKLSLGLMSYSALSRLQAQAAAPGATESVRKEWSDFIHSAAPPPETAVEDLRAYRGSWREAAQARIAFARIMQTQILAYSLLDTFALTAIGIALFRNGFFNGTWPRRRYWQIVAGGFLVAAPLYVPLVLWIESTRFSPVTLVATEAIHLTLLRPWMSLAWASLVILFVQSPAMPWLSNRLTAAGRMAFSNYLGTSIVCTLIFNGYGLGWFGYLSRWQLYAVVALVWALILLWSKPWLDYYRYGPFEWLWRSLSRWHLQPMRR